MAVQEANYVLGNIETKTANIPWEYSWSVLKSKLEALKIRAHPKNADIEEILADIPRGEKNRKPTEKQYSIPCPSFGFSNCTKTFCVSNQWWDLRPLNSDRTSNHIYVHWYNHLKVIYDTKIIPQLVLNMADNHLRIL